MKENKYSGKTVWKLKYFSSTVNVGMYYEVRQQSYA